MGPGEACAEALARRHMRAAMQPPRFYGGSSHIGSEFLCSLSYMLAALLPMRRLGWLPVRRPGRLPCCAACALLCPA